MLELRMAQETLNGLPLVRRVRIARRLFADLYLLDRKRLTVMNEPGVHRALVHSAFQARSVLVGNPTWLVAVRAPDETPDYVFATLQRGRLRSELTVTALGKLPLQEDCWTVLEQLAENLAATSILVETVTGEPTSHVPAVDGEIVRYIGERLYVVDLADEGQASNLSKNTKRNIARAAKAGVRIDVSTTASALEAHFELTGASIDRRAGRGEDVTQRASAERVRKMLADGCGRLFQATLDGEALSSDFVFQLGGSAYYYDGGSSSRGMALGSSHYLMSEILSRLQSDGLHAINLGLARAGNEGLARFKEGFGARLAHVERVLVKRDRVTRMTRNMIRSCFPPGT